MVYLLQTLGPKPLHSLPSRLRAALPAMATKPQLETQVRALEAQVKSLKEQLQASDLIELMIFGDVVLAWSSTLSWSQQVHASSTLSPRAEAAQPNREQFLQEREMLQDRREAVVKRESELETRFQDIVARL